ncbi:hypothetical protein [Agrococcus sp. Ld7]|uniref:CsbD family protein n=1 Tax=Agrococcus sp. Ld7 TaxID=649148 RepID=UPI0038708682
MTVHHPQEPQSRQPHDPTGVTPTDPTGVTPTDPTGVTPTDPTGVTPTDPTASTGSTDDRVARAPLGTDSFAAPAAASTSDRAAHDAPLGAPHDASQGTSQVAKDEAAHVSGTAKEQAGNVADTAKDAARGVADTAKGEANQVVGEAKRQASQLLDETMHEVRDQAKTQQRRAAEGMRTFGDDLHEMTGSADDSLASQLVGEVAQRVSAAAGWLEQREPADLLDEVKSFARRRPGTFIAIAGIAGLLVGRLARGMVGDAQEQREPEGRTDATAGSSRSIDAASTHRSDTAAVPVDNEPWHGERPAADVPGAASPLRSTDQIVNGYPGARREGGQ